MFVAAGIEKYRIESAPPPGNYYDEAARNNITPCQNLNDYNPYQYQQVCLNWMLTCYPFNVVPCHSGLLEMAISQDTATRRKQTRTWVASVLIIQYLFRCDDTYPSSSGPMLNLTCISCNDIPQMSSLSVFWQVMVMI
jgi:hypothetical protein